jgi:hypothetical protein
MSTYTINEEKNELYTTRIDIFNIIVIADAISKHFTETGMKLKISKETKKSILNASAIIPIDSPVVTQVREHEKAISYIVDKIEYLKDWRVFFEVLHELNVLQKLMPNLHNLVLLKEGTEHHMEASVFEHTMMMLDLVKDDNLTVKYAVLFHDIGKPHTYKTTGSGKGHDDYDLIKSLIDLPIQNQEDILELCSNHVNIYKLHTFSTRKATRWLQSISSYQQLVNLTVLAEADDIGRLRLPSSEPKIINSSKLLIAYKELEKVTQRYLKCIQGINNETTGNRQI